MLTNSKWQNWQTAAALRNAAKLAKQLDDDLNRIFKNAALADRKRLENTALEAIEVSEIADAAAKLSDELQADAEVT